MGGGGGGGLHIRPQEVSSPFIRRYSSKKNCQVNHNSCPGPTSTEAGGTFREGRGKSHIKAQEGWAGSGGTGGESITSPMRLKFS